ncbi:Protein Lilipod [Armadillidium vulgare]|nr:Protein Lilipod [Armadillidium vulgare]
MSSPKITNISLLLPDEPIQGPFEDEINFNNTVREYILFSLVLLFLLVISHIIILRFKRRELSAALCHSSFDLWLCTFSLSVSLGAVQLLPISILTNEVLTIYKDSYYVKWINLSLIQGLWNMIFLCSNVSLFIGLPFAYFFTESEGFPGSKKKIIVSVLGIKSKNNRNCCSSMSSSCPVVWCMDIVGFPFSIPEVWGSFYLPLLYSFISCLGVLVLLLCTPVGFAHLFTVLGQLVLKSTSFLKDIAEEHQMALLKEEAIARQLERVTSRSNCIVQPMLKPSTYSSLSRLNDVQYVLGLYNEAKQTRLKIEEKRKAGLLKRTLAYPLTLVILLALTSTSIFIVVLNTLQLLVGIKALPLSSAPAILGEPQQGKRIVLLSMLGPVGAIIEVLLILYLIAASLLGCYSLPFIRAIRPRRQETPMTHIIANCLVVLLLSSALPLLVRTLGITNFDLLGDYGEISWLGHFWIVLGYNILFAAASALCLVKKFTATLRHEIVRSFKSICERDVIAFILKDIFQKICLNKKEDLFTL